MLSEHMHGGYPSVDTGTNNQVMRVFEHHAVYLHPALAAGDPYGSFATAVTCLVPLIATYQRPRHT